MFGQITATKIFINDNEFCNVMLFNPIIGTQTQSQIFYFSNFEISNNKFQNSYYVIFLSLVFSQLKFNDHTLII